MGFIFGNDTPQVAQVDTTQFDPLISQYNQQIQGRSPASQAQFENMAGQSLSNTLEATGAMKGVRPGQKASMMNNALSKQQSQLAGTSAMMAAQERQSAMSGLGQLMMGKAGLETGINQFNAQQQTAANDRFSKLLGTGLTAGAMVMGGPAAGMGMGALTSDAGSSGMTQSPFMLGQSSSTNPYAKFAGSSSYGY